MQHPTSCTASRGLSQTWSRRRSAGLSRKAPMRRQATDRPCLSANRRPTASPNTLLTPVDAVRPRNNHLVDEAVAPIEPDRVMRTRIDDATHTLSPRRLEHIPGSDHVVGQDLVPRVLAWDRAEVDNAI